MRMSEIKDLMIRWEGRRVWRFWHANSLPQGYARSAAEHPKIGRATEERKERREWERGTYDNLNQPSV